MKGKHLLEFRRAAKGWKEVRRRWDFPMEVASWRGGMLASQHSLRGKDRERFREPFSTEVGDAYDPGILNRLPSSPFDGAGTGSGILGASCPPHSPGE